MDPTARARLVAATPLVLAVGLAAVFSGRVVEGAQARAEDIVAHAKTPKEAERDALSRELNFKSDRRYYENRVAADLEKHGLAAVSVAEIARVQPFFDELDAPKVLRPGKRLVTPHLELRASIEKVRFRQHGATVAARHSVLTIKNRSDKPIAYFVDAHVADGRKCKARGARMHNAMALLPGESAEVAVCAGTGSVEVSKIQVLETTPLGVLYFSRVPPSAVGHDAATAQAHRPAFRTEVCTRVPAVRIANALREGRIAWADVADFYTRHPCDEYQMPLAYRRATEPVAELPLVPPTGGRPAEGP